MLHTILYLALKEIGNAFIEKGVEIFLYLSKWKNNSRSIEILLLILFTWETILDANCFEFWYSFIVLWKRTKGMKPDMIHHGMTGLLYIFWRKGVKMIVYRNLDKFSFNFIHFTKFKQIYSKSTWMNAFSQIFKK